MTVLLVALGGAIGAAVRHLVGHHLDAHPANARPSWPWGTLLVNVSGSFLLGWLSALSLDGHQTAFLGVGFCGALTTYSTFGVQTVGLGLRRGAAYAAGTILLAVGACVLGFQLS